MSLYPECKHRHSHAMLPCPHCLNEETQEADRKYMQSLREELATLTSTLATVTREKEEARNRLSDYAFELAATRKARDIAQQLHKIASERQVKAITDPVELAVLRTQLAEATRQREEAKEALSYVERLACHHGAKSLWTAEQILSMIQHYPPIEEITESYKL